MDIYCAYMVNIPYFIENGLYTYHLAHCMSFCLYLAPFQPLRAHWYICYTIPPSQLSLAYSFNQYGFALLLVVLWLAHLSSHIFLSFCSFWTLITLKLFIHCSIALNFTYGVGTNMVPVSGTFPSGNHCYYSTSCVWFQIGSTLHSTLHIHPMELYQGGTHISLPWT